MSALPAVELRHPIRTARSLLERHEIRYLLVAGTTSLVYIGLVATGLALGWPYMWAILAAQAVTISGAFPAYRTLVFRSHGRVATDFVRFLSVWSSGAIAGLVATPFLVEVVGWPPLVSQIIAIVVVAVCSYLGHRFFSFRHTTDRDASTDTDPEKQARVR